MQLPLSRQSCFEANGGLWQDIMSLQSHDHTRAVMKQQLVIVAWQVGGHGQPRGPEMAFSQTKLASKKQL